MAVRKEGRGREREERLHPILCLLLTSNFPPQRYRLSPVPPSVLCFSLSLLDAAAAAADYVDGRNGGATERAALRVEMEKAAGASSFSSYSFSAAAATLAIEALLRQRGIRWLRRDRLFYPLLLSHTVLTKKIFIIKVFSLAE